MGLAHFLRIPAIRGGGAALGPELVTNGDFASDVAGWSATGGTITWVAGEGSLNWTGSGAGVNQTIAATAIGQVYEFKARIRRGTYTGNIAFQATQSAALTTIGTVTGPASTDMTEYSFQFTADTTTTQIKITRATASTGTLVIDDISVRSVL